ncbi:hypothetical protein LPJ62_003946 [Coemansia sp. RSA 2167]|nr:hypothetical protein LPJ62_003946 [Coemansia sp. RSA 2167]KAJ2149951.1 hypothetical protein J3F82_004274 [Coemansia sp. RSA 637]KAJ2838235.1 hypothetical protein J3B01_001529 [Coemansia erecta]
MSINLEEQITYQLQVGTSLQGSDADSDEFHLVSRQLARTTTKLARETLENGHNTRVRVPNARDADKRSILLEADSSDLKSTCTYEGDYEVVSKGDDTDDEIACVLIYDDEVNAFTIERVATMPVIKTGVPNSVSVAANASSGSLLLPTNKHDPEKVKQPARRESESVMDEALEDELAKELEGMLSDDDNDSDGGRMSRRNSSKQTDKRVNSEEQLNTELADSLNEALFEAAGSDEDEFEEVDGSEVLAARRDSSRNMSTDADPLFDRRSTLDDDDEDEMLFEEIDPSVELGGTEFSPQNSRAGGSMIEDDSDQFEEISGSRVNSMISKSTGDDALFGSFTASPISYSDQQPLQQAGKKSSSMDPGTDTVDDEFEDFDLDLTRSLESS